MGDKGTYSLAVWLRRQYQPIGDRMVWPVLSSLAKTTGFRDGILYIALVSAALLGVAEGIAQSLFETFVLFLLAGVALYGVTLFAACMVGKRLRDRDCADDFLVAPVAHDLFAKAFVQHFFVCTCFTLFVLIAGSLVCGVSYYLTSWFREAKVSLADELIGPLLGYAGLSLLTVALIAPIAWGIYFGLLAGGRLAALPFVLIGAYALWPWWVSYNEFELYFGQILSFYLLLASNMLVFGYITYQYLRLHYSDRLRQKLFA